MCIQIAKRSRAHQPTNDNISLLPSPVPIPQITHTHKVSHSVAKSSASLIPKMLQEGRYRRHIISKQKHLKLQLQEMQGQMEQMRVQQEKMHEQLNKKQEQMQEQLGQKQGQMEGQLDRVLVALESLVTSK